MERVNLNFLDNVKQIISSTSPTSSFYAIAKFILANKNKKELWTKKLPIYQLATLTHTSSPSITRFAQKVGLTGFKELLIVMKNNIETKKNQVKSESNLWNIIPDQEFLFRSSIILNDVYDNLKTLKQINENLSVKKRIFFFGYNEQALLFKIILPMLEEMGIKIYYNENEKEQEQYLSKLERGDLVILLSTTFQEKIFSLLWPKVKRMKLFSVIMTKNWENRIVNSLTDKIVFKVSEDSNFNLEEKLGEVNLLFYLKLLFIGLLDLRVIK